MARGGSYICDRPKYAASHTRVEALLSVPACAFSVGFRNDQLKITIM
ncbi:MAG: hypothetical protein ACLR6J_12300 [Parabacteroides merdae]